MHGCVGFRSESDPTEQRERMMKLQSCRCTDASAREGLARRRRHVLHQTLRKSTLLPHTLGSGHSGHNSSHGSAAVDTEMAFDRQADSTALGQGLQQPHDRSLRRICRHALFHPSHTCSQADAPKRYTYVLPEPGNNAPRILPPLYPIVALKPLSCPSRHFKSPTHAVPTGYKSTQLPACVTGRQ